MQVRVTLLGRQWAWGDPAKARAAAAGMGANAARYEAKAREARTLEAKILSAADDAQEREQASKAARKAAKQGE